MVFSREEITKRLRNRLQSGCPILGVNAGLGLTAKVAQHEDMDLVFVDGTGRLRVTGGNPLTEKFAYGDANSIVLKMAGEILPMAENLPCIAGVFAEDTFKKLDMVLKNLKEWGFSGITNIPGMGMMKPVMAKNLELGGIGLSKEYELMQLARDMGFYTCAVSYSDEQTEKFAETGADMLMFHMGFANIKDEPADEALMAKAIGELKERTEYARKVSPSSILMCYAGPFNRPEEIARIFDEVPLVEGYMTGACVEGFPIFHEIAATVDAFKGEVKG